MDLHPCNRNSVPFTCRQTHLACRRANTTARVTVVFNAIAFARHIHLNIVPSHAFSLAASISLCRRCMYRNHTSAASRTSRAGNHSLYDNAFLLDASPLARSPSKNQNHDIVNLTPHLLPQLFQGRRQAAPQSPSPRRLQRPSGSATQRALSSQPVL
jgi:hypothetical protein